MDARLEKVPGLKGLYYDKDTKVVYYVEKNLIDHAWCITAMTPYLGRQHGRTCYYDVYNKEIREFSTQD